MNSYDAVPYESYPYQQSHPDRMATVSLILGHKTAPLPRCRVLEIGCAAGGNLLPMALAFPESKFLGIDLSKVEIDQGRKMIDDLGIANLELRHQGIQDLPTGEAQFDYIISHGVFSWISDDLQNKLLSACRDHLSATGVAYISYNTYPGWHLREIVRDMLKYHSRSFPEPAMKVKQARNFLDFLNKTASHEQNPFTLLLRNELESFRRSSDSYLFHEHLEEFNRPVYFYQFVERAAAMGLRYLGESDLRVMVPGNFPPEIENVLQILSQDQIHLEQYMDFVRNRTFRQTLLCRQDRAPNSQLRWEQLRRLHIGSPARPVNEKFDIHSSEAEQFRSPEGVGVAVRDPLMKAAMLVLSERWPESMTFDSLLTEARARLGDRVVGTESEQAKSLGQAILHFYASASTSLVEIHLHPPQLVNRVTETPTASRLARYQAEHRVWVTNQRHEPVHLSEFERSLIRLLDGTRDKAKLLQEMTDYVKEGKLEVEREGRLVQDDTELLEVLDKAIDHELKSFVQRAILIG